MAPRLPIMLRPSRRKVLFLIAAALAFLVASIWEFEKDPVSYGLMAGFLALFVVAGCVYLHPRASYLKLTTTGFEYSLFFQRTFIPWSSVAEFVPITIGRLDRVAWRTTPRSANSTGMTRVKESIMLAGKPLPDTYGYSSHELAQLMNELRLKYARST